MTPLPAPRRSTPRWRTVVAGLVLALAVPLVAATPAPAPSPDPVRAAEYWIDGAHVDAAWRTTRGAGVTIAIIDTGIGKGPHAFDGAVTGGTDVSGIGSSDGRTPLGPLDSDHGSRVASLAAGRPNADGTGMIGVAPEASLLSISLGFGTTATVPFAKQVATAMVWAVDHGAKVINLSFTTNTLDWDPSWDDAFLYAFQHDVVVVVAAGNRGSGTSMVGAPATIPGVLTVAGVDQRGVASRAASTQGISIAVSAPSEALLGVDANGTVETWNGTSGAAPIVAGIVALVRAAHPELSADDVINQIIQTARPAAQATAHPDPLYGYGLVDASAAVSAALPHVTANPLGDLSEWIRLHRRAPAEQGPQPTTAPVAIPALPPAEGPATPGSPLIPSADSLLYGTLPLVALTVPGILIGLGVTAAARRIRSARASRTPNP
ncbi:S8 family peptidase [Microbacterium sp. ASV81]|uniref:S8 family serine peptidase n=1 Tax=Microbacterium capsulatum TaxID=3041921 RepID=A0ABU0XFM5_9MICO|nr:S8 family serine peptidase [Microbacterium sp. ASV81]MDQ4213923.1 S8 family serine peptidase [Microbacterium sp. ASV81]